MDHNHFEVLLRAFATSPSRRTALRLLVGSALGSLVTLGAGDAAAHDVLKKCKKIKDKVKKKKCVKKAKAHDATHTIETSPDATQTSAPPPVSPPPPLASPPPPSGCQGGMMVCGGGCIDPQTDPNHCGGCGQPCTVQAPETCGTTGQCVGGTCKRYELPTICRQPVCVDSGTSRHASYCDGTGNCASSGTRPCDPGRCDSATGQCTWNCSVDSDCDSDGYCDVFCRSKKYYGSSCTRSEECSYGNCVTGVCCESACIAANATGTCSAPGGYCAFTCNAGWGNCDNTRGCEADLQSHPAHCGGCNQPCSGPCGPNDSGARECVEGSCFCTF